MTNFVSLSYSIRICFLHKKRRKASPSGGDNSIGVAAFSHSYHPQYTSQKCSECGRVEADNRSSQSVFHCKACGHTENADTNAAKNVLREGLSRLACPEKGVALKGHRETVQLHRSLKQEIRSRLVA